MFPRLVVGRPRGTVARSAAENTGERENVRPARALAAKMLPFRSVARPNESAALSVFLQRTEIEPNETTPTYPDTPSAEFRKLFVGTHHGPLPNFE